MQRLNKLIASFLLLALSVFIVPKELLHELHHHDTIDKITNNDLAQISELHHHCIALELSSPPFLHTISFFKIFLPAATAFFHLPCESVYFSELYNLSSLRGPPALY